MNIVNLTPHAIVVRGRVHGVDSIFDPSGSVARVAQTPGSPFQPALVAADTEG